MRRVRILEQAAEEAIEAAAWYEHEHLGLGIEFAHAVNAAIDLLEEEIVPLTKMPGAAGARGVIKTRPQAFPVRYRRAGILRRNYRCRYRSSVSTPRVLAKSSPHLTRK